jgi:predicted AAA+ superfamily ATPase
MISKDILPRAMTAVVSRALEIFPVVVLTGARQTGKSTLAKDLAPLSHRRYLTLDVALNRSLAASEPQVLLAPSDPTPITIDEVQRTPDLLLSIKQAVDTHRVNGRYLLTGSANLLLMQRVSESLAGRARYLTLWPLTRREQLGLGACGIWTEFFTQERQRWPDIAQAQTVATESWQELALRGGYPQAALLGRGPQAYAARNEIFSGYTQTYLERDLRDLASIDNLPDFQRLMRSACLRLGSVLNQVELARDAGLARTSAQRYLNLLEVSYQLIKIEPYSVNRTKRLIKSPKMYWSDTGLAMHLADATTASGAHLENLICTDLLAWRETQSTRPAILYWRTSTGEEVDFVVEWQGRLLAVEVKATTNPGYNDSRGLRSFLQEYGNTALGGLLLHGGDSTFWLASGVLAVPWSTII